MRWELFFLVALVFLVIPPGIAQREYELKGADSGGYIWVPADEWFKLRHEMGNHFTEALNKFKQKDRKGSAESIRRANVFVRTESTRALDDMKPIVEGSADRLDRLATGVESGKVRSLKDLEYAFARTHHVLARHQLERAKAEEGVAHSVNFGRAMRRVILNLRRGYAWAGKELETETETVLEEANEISEVLIEGATMEHEKVEEPLDLLDEEVQKLGKTVESATP